jgi:hypothetical protein
MLEFNLLEYMRTAIESLTVILYIRSLENHTSLIQGRFVLFSGGFAPWKGVFILFRLSSFRVVKALGERALGVLRVGGA